MCEYHDIPSAKSGQRFPLNGLVAQSRIAYQTAPIATCDRPVSIDLGAQPARLLPQRPSHTDAHIEFDARWGAGHVTGPHFTRMVLAGLGMTEMPGRFAARSCVSNVTKFSKREIVA